MEELKAEGDADESDEPIYDWTNLTLANALVDLNSNWKTRCAALEELVRLCLLADVESFSKLMEDFSPKIATQIYDRRSIVVKKSTAVVESLAVSRKELMTPFAPFFLETLFSNVKITVKIIAKSSDQCCTTIVQNVPDDPDVSILLKLIEGSRHKSTQVRASALRYIRLQLVAFPIPPETDQAEEPVDESSSSGSNETSNGEVGEIDSNSSEQKSSKDINVKIDRQSLICEALKVSAADSHQEVRTEALWCLSEFAKGSSEHAQSVLDGLSSSAKARYDSELAKEHPFCEDSSSSKLKKRRKARKQKFPTRREKFKRVKKSTLDERIMVLVAENPPQQNSDKMVDCPPCSPTTPSKSKTELLLSFMDEVKEESADGKTHRIELLFTSLLNLDSPKLVPKMVKFLCIEEMSNILLGFVSRISPELKNGHLSVYPDNPREFHQMNFDKSNESETEKVKRSYRLLQFLSEKPKDSPDAAKSFLAQQAELIAYHALACWSPKSKGNCYHAGLLLKQLFAAAPKEFFETLLSDRCLYLFKNLLFSGLHCANPTEMIMDILSSTITPEIQPLRRELFRRLNEWKFLETLIDTICSSNVQEDISSAYALFFEKFIVTMATHDDDDVGAFLGGSISLITRQLFAAISCQDPSRPFWQKISCCRLLNFLNEKLLASKAVSPAKSIMSFLVFAPPKSLPNKFHSEFPIFLDAIRDNLNSIFDAFLGIKLDSPSLEENGKNSNRFSLFHVELLYLFVNLCSHDNIEGDNDTDVPNSISSDEVRARKIHFLEKTPDQVWELFIDWLFLHRDNSILMCSFKKLFNIALKHSIDKTIPRLLEHSQLLKRLLQFYSLEQDRCALHSLTVDLSLSLLQKIEPDPSTAETESEPETETENETVVTELKQNGDVPMESQDSSPPPPPAPSVVKDPKQQWLVEFLETDSDWQRLLPEIRVEHDRQACDKFPRPKPLSALGNSIELKEFQNLMNTVFTSGGSDDSLASFLSAMQSQNVLFDELHSLGEDDDDDDDMDIEHPISILPIEDDDVEDSAVDENVGTGQSSDDQPDSPSDDKPQTMVDLPREDDGIVNT